MSVWRLILRSLRYYWRTLLGVVVGAAIGAAVLVGALAVGDSVRSSLHEGAAQRVGKIDVLLHGRDRWFESSLADRLAEDLHATVAPAVNLPGIASSGGGALRTGIVDVFGVDARFFELSPRGERRAITAGKAWINQRLAAQLSVRAGDAMLLRVEKPSALPRDVVLSTIDDVSFAIRVEVAGVLDDAQFGRFGLRASQIPPFDVFVSLVWLQEQLELGARANMIAVGKAADGAVLAARADVALRRRWTLADAELRASLSGDGVAELASGRVFVEPGVIAAARAIAPDAVGVLTYFVISLRHGARTTPYSTVAGIGPLTPKTPPTEDALGGLLGLVPTGPQRDESIVLNQWLADDLKAKVGDHIELEYFVMGEGQRLVKATHSLRVSRVIPVRGAAADASLMPEFPGLADAKNCRDWEPGVPVDLDRIRDKDEQYWDEHRGTPKAFVTLGTACRLWSNRFGDLTAIRAPVARAERLRVELPRKLDPAAVGLRFVDLRGRAFAAGVPATDFGGLFLGLSFFLIIGAVLLTALLFVFGVEQRTSEVGMLLAVGFRRTQVRRLFLLEALVLAGIGGALGVFLGIGYTRLVLRGLATIWRDAVGQTTVTFHASATMLGIGVVSSVLIALLAIAWALRKAFRQPAALLLRSEGTSVEVRAGGRFVGHRELWFAGVCVVFAVVVALKVQGTDAEAGAFFGVGALVLVAGILVCRWLLRRFAASRTSLVSVAALCRRNAGRRRGRSWATIALRASGTFLVTAVQTGRLEPPHDATERASGTGGFAFFGRTTLPVLRDLQTAEGREAYGLDRAELAGARIVAMRVRDGDDASCLNLSLPQNPRLFGVRSQEFVERGAFSFVSGLPLPGGSEPRNRWQLLDADFGPDVVPAIGDQASVQWTLHKALGDAIEYVDERGHAFQVRIVATVRSSVLQGNLVVAAKQLERRFPSASGYRAFLIDASSDRAAAVSASLTRALEDVGLELTPTADRLRAFNAIQNTYLMIFQVLGALGVLLGCVGLGVVVLRNALERRSELATLSALGWERRSIRQLIWGEHAWLVALGLACGLVAAVLAVLPGLFAGTLTWTPIAGIVAAVGLTGLFWVWLATRVASGAGMLKLAREE